MQIAILLCLPIVLIRTLTPILNNRMERRKCRRIWKLKVNIVDQNFNFQFFSDD